MRRWLRSLGFNTASSDGRLRGLRTGVFGGVDFLLFNVFGFSSPLHGASCSVVQGAPKTMKMPTPFLIMKLSLFLKGTGVLHNISYSTRILVFVACFEIPNQGSSLSPPIVNMFACETSTRV